MIVTCPACNTRYNLSDAQLGATGRTIQCVKCQFSWFQTPAEMPSKKESGGDAPTATAPIAPDSSVTATTTEKKSARDIAMALPQPIIIGGALTLLAIIVLLVTLLIMNPFAPNNPSGYRALHTFDGTRDSSAQTALTLGEVDRKVITDGDIAVLIFTGSVENTGSLPLEIPEIRVQLLDRKGVELDFWPVQTAKNTLAAGASTTWSVRFLEPDLERISEYRVFFHSGQ